MKANYLVKYLPCQALLDAIEQPDDSLLVYSADTRSYTISTPRALMKKDMVWLGYCVEFCPFCGAKLPKDLADERFEILETEYGINDPYDSKQKKLIPKEFKTDEWWKKRAL